MKRLLTSLAGVAIAVLSTLHASVPTLSQDRGAAGAWQRILKLQTTASVMHTTAHPDDEHGGVLAQLSRGRGARVSLLTLTRGESGDNAIGPELFDALGLIRTEELLVAGNYYGVDRQYFTTVVDYGFSKRLEEALVKWGRENVLRDVVRIIRIDRPFVVIARFQGNERDGHGNHQAAGLITQEAFRAAGDPAIFPDQIRDGLRPWQPLKLYMGGVRENEQWQVKTDASEYSPWLGQTYQAFARLRLSFQRSQNGGRVGAPPASAPAYYRRLASAPGLAIGGDAREESFFDGIDTSLSGLFTTLGHTEPPGARALLTAIESDVREAAAAFSLTNPSGSVRALARALIATRRAIAQLKGDPDAVFILEIKEQQLADAINAALGLDFHAIAQVPGPVVPGQNVRVDVSLTNNSPVDITYIGMDLVVGTDSEAAGAAKSDAPLGRGGTLRETFTVTIPENATATRPYFERASIQQARYTVRDTSQLFRAAVAPPIAAHARYVVDGARVDIRGAVERREPRVPYGEELRELAVVPALVVNISPRSAIVRLGAERKTVDVRVDLINNAEFGGSGQLTLHLPQGWAAAPPNVDFTFRRAGEKSAYRFVVSIPTIEARAYLLEAVATMSGRSYAEGYDAIEHRDLETRYLYHPAATQIRGVDVAVAANLNVGYVMGVGDEVPSAIAQLGARVTLLSDRDLSSGDLRQYDAIFTGTRAYAVRDDLKANNRRLLDYVKAGGNLVVLYNTPELIPDEFAPYPAELTARAEEVSEEDSPVDILAPQHRLFTSPNRITKADFDGWVEQRGSKFFSSWDRAYTPMISTHDAGQPPQRGGWLTAEYGKGHYTYFAYALHRQLPYGAAGAYRILANLLSLGR